MCHRRDNLVSYQSVTKYDLRFHIFLCKGSKTLLDSGFHAVDSGFHLLDSRSFSVELGFRIRIVSGIPDSHTRIPDSKAQDSGFHKQKISKIPDSKCKNFPDSGIRIPLRGGDIFELNHEERSGYV